MYNTRLTLKVLSVDWDYFVNAEMDPRVKYFPDGGSEDIPTDIQDFIWTMRYTQYKDELLSIKSDRSQLFLFNKILNNSSPAHLNDISNLLICDSHKNIYDFIISTTRNIEIMMGAGFDFNLEIINIDFHHDLYNIKDIDGNRISQINCGNWVWQLFKYFLSDSSIIKYKWIRRKTSDMKEYNIACDYFKDNSCIDISDDVGITDDVLNFNPDIIFICRSREWSPPHLDKSFIRQTKRLCDQNKFWNTMIEKDIFEDRWRSISRELNYNNDIKQFELLMKTYNKH
jgi:hypothetical protein